MNTRNKIFGFLSCSMAILLFGSAPVVSQTVMEYVSFDLYVSPTDNDFVNEFNNGTGLSQITTSGITGGCLTTPNTVSWGNDNAIYCSKYMQAPSNISSTRISFKYDTTQINTSNFDRAVSIFLRPSADFNHYVIASITHDKKIQIISYSWVNNMPTVTLQHNHWYEFILTTDIVSASPTWQMNANAQVNDLGLTGQFPPIPAGSSTGTFSDSIFTVDPAVEVSFTATQWGGAKYIDNFRFQGVKSPDSCAATSLASIEPDEMDVIVENDFITIKNCKIGSGIELFNINGKLVYNGAWTNEDHTFSTAFLEPGVYFLRVGDERKSKTRKIVLTDRM